jgi:hypothetical protein
MRLRFISVIIILCSFNSCKRASKLPELSIEEFQKREYDSVKKLLSLSRFFYEKENYEKTISTLENLISRYATYSEILEALELLNAARIKHIIIKIHEASEIEPILVLIENNISPDIAISASNKVEKLIRNSEDISQLEDYLSQNKVKEHATLASNKIAELKENEMDEAYVSAVENKSSSQWKIFLENYPKHPKRNEIEKTIIILEVSEIFSGEYGEIPESQISGAINNSESTIVIKNDTKYTLTLRYSGPDIIKISISPYKNQSIKLKSGVYKVAVSVNASDVRNFAGSENLHGEYSSNYYLSTFSYKKK